MHRQLWCCEVPCGTMRYQAVPVSPPNSAWSCWGPSSRSLQAGSQRWARHCEHAQAGEASVRCSCAVAVLLGLLRGRQLGRSGNTTRLHAAGWPRGAAAAAPGPTRGVCPRVLHHDALAEVVHGGGAHHAPPAPSMFKGLPRQRTCCKRRGTGGGAEPGADAPASAAAGVTGGAVSFLPPHRNSSGLS